ncbi:MAG: hypothetical protein WAV00_11495 [Nocardioides sp.]
MEGHRGPQLLTADLGSETGHGHAIGLVAVAAQALADRQREIGGASLEQVGPSPTTLDTYAHLWPDSDESTRTAIDAVMQERAAKRESDSAAE